MLQLSVPYFNFGETGAEVCFFLKLSEALLPPLYKRKIKMFIRKEKFL